MPRPRVTRVGVGAAWVAAGAAVVVTGWDAGNGLDPTDEASYLQAVLGSERREAFNGLFGFALHPLWVLAGWDVARVRLLGLALLIGVAVLLGSATAGLARRPPGLVLPMTVAASTGYYAVGWRIPSYNWLALLGAGLVCAGLLRLLAGGRGEWGLVCGLGIAVAAYGKLPSAVLLAGLVALASWRNRRSLACAGAALVGAAVVHALVVLPAPATVDVLVRSSAMLSAVSPDTYTISAGVLSSLLGDGSALLDAAVGGGVAALLALTVVLPGPHRHLWYRRLCPVVVATAGAASLLIHAWSGGTAQGPTSGLLPVLLAVALAGGIARAAGLPPAAGARAAIAGAFVLGGSAFAYAFASNVGAGWQFTMAALLLAPACLLACAALPDHGGGHRTLAVLAGVVCIGSVVVAVQARDDPRRSAPVAQATVPVSLGRVTVRTDPGTARELASLTAAAARAGWRAGTPLIDTTFTPAVPLALQARVPPVLLPAFPGDGVRSVCQAVRGLDRGWRDAWLLVPVAAPDDEIGRVASYLGRHYPEDYLEVTTFGSPWSEYPGRLLRPRMDGGLLRPGGCLTDSNE